MRILSALVLSLVLSPLPLAAGETAWQELAPGVSVRLISEGVVDAAGNSMMAMEINMPADTKTYWRIPGETGLPMEIDFSQSVGVAGAVQHWPHPMREDQKGYLDYVYYGHTVLPIELQVSDAGGVVDLEATLGICSDICVPAQARLSLPVADAERDDANALRIRQALASVPIAWDAGDEPIGRVEVLPDASAVLVEIVGAEIDPASLIVAGGPGAPLFGAPQKSPQGDLVQLPIIGKTDNSGLDGMEVDLSFMTPMGAYEISRTLEAGDNAGVDALGQ
jgi:DsbC/DsbD-like thiol-disulfide interchange protein